MRVGWNPYYKPPPGSVIDYQDPLANGLVGCWLTNEGAGATEIRDLTRNRQNGTLTGTPTWTASEKGWALDHNGSSDYVTFGTDLFTESELAAGTISIWAKAASLPSAEKVVFAAENVCIIRWDTYLLGGYKIGIYTYDGSGEDAIGTTWSTGEWAHLLITWDGTTVYFYKDGAEIGNSPAGVPDWDSATATWYIGQRNNGRYWDGDVTNLQIWNRALSGAEVAQLYRQPYGFIRTPAPRKWYWDTVVGDVTVTPSAQAGTGAQPVPVPEVRVLADLV